MFSSLTRSSLQSAILIFVGSASLYAQSNASTARSELGAIPSVSAKVLIGWPGVAPDTEGDLSFGTKSLSFTNERSSGEISKSRIIAVSSGDEQIETGGTTGRIARVVIPYGGGLALGAVTHKKVGLLTIEFLDASGEYHGAVFQLKAADMSTTLDRIAFRPSAGTALRTLAPVSCPKCRSN